MLFPTGEEVDHEAEEVLNELNSLTESEADSGGQGDEYPVGGEWTYEMVLIPREYKYIPSVRPSLHVRTNICRQFAMRQCAVSITSQVSGLPP